MLWAFSIKVLGPSSPSAPHPLSLNAHTHTHTHSHPIDWSYHPRKISRSFIPPSLYQYSIYRLSLFTALKNWRSKCHLIVTYHCLVKFLDEKNQILQKVLIFWRIFFVAPQFFFTFLFNLRVPLNPTHGKVTFFFTTLVYFITDVVNK